MVRVVFSLTSFHIWVWDWKVFFMALNLSVFFLILSDSRSYLKDPLLTALQGDLRQWLLIPGDNACLRVYVFASGEGERRLKGLRVLIQSLVINRTDHLAKLGLGLFPYLHHKSLLWRFKCTTSLVFPAESPLSLYPTERIWITVKSESAIHVSEPSSQP